MDIFNSQPGIVKVFESEKTLPGAIVLSDETGVVEFRAAIITDLRVEQSTGQQFQIALDNAVYVYVFGDNPGDLIVEGRAFQSVCDGGSKSGLDEIFDFYKENRLAVNDTPIALQIGANTLTGFLTGMSIGGFDPESRINRFSLKIKALPRI